MELRIIKSTLFIISVFIFSTACFYDNEEELYPGSQDIECSTDSLTYNNTVAEIINTNCAIPNCHGGTQSPSLTGFQNVMSNAGRIKVRAVEQQTMPPLSEQPLSECEIKQLEAWINNGAPEN